MTVQPNYNKTLRACCLGYVTQAICANFAPLLFLTFQKTYRISLGQIALIPSVFFLTQLLMDLAGVECITVVGASSGSTSDHAWNMVRLEGEWYCVDPTWDDQVTYISYDYFLVSDGHMDGHIWTAYPNWPVCPSDYPRP